MKKEEEEIVESKYVYILIAIICIALCSVMAFKQSLIKEKTINPKIEIHGKVYKRG